MRITADDLNTAVDVMIDRLTDWKKKHPGEPVQVPFFLVNQLKMIGGR